jgi:ArsR family transcriptional regulator
MAETNLGVSLVPRLKAVADETRITILSQLASGERCVCELTEVLDIKQPLLSFHLRILKEAGLIKGRRAGRWSYYSLDEQAVQELTVDLGELTSPTRTASGPRRACS